MVSSKNLIVNASLPANIVTSLLAVEPGIVLGVSVLPSAAVRSALLDGSHSAPLSEPSIEFD